MDCKSTQQSRCRYFVEPGDNRIGRTKFLSGIKVAVRGVMFEIMRQQSTFVGLPQKSVEDVAQKVKVRHR